MLSSTYWTYAALAFGGLAAYVILTRVKVGDTVIVPVRALTVGGVSILSQVPDAQATIRVTVDSGEQLQGVVVSVSGFQSFTPSPADPPVSFQRSAVTGKV